MIEKETIRRAKRLRNAAIRLKDNRILRDDPGLREYCSAVVDSAESAMAKGDLSYIRPTERKLVS